MKYNPEDRQLTGIELTELATNYAPQLQEAGLQEGTVGFNRVMANIMELASEDDNGVVLGRFMAQLPGVVQEGATIEQIARARTNSYMNDDGDWEYNKDLGSPDDFYAMQRSLAGMFDFQGRIQ